MVGKFERICFRIKCLLSIKEFAVLPLFKFQIFIRSHGIKLQNIKEPIYDACHRSCCILVLVDCFTKFAIAQACTSTCLQYTKYYFTQMFFLQLIWRQCIILTSDNVIQLISHQLLRILAEKKNNSQTCFSFQSSMQLSLD